MRHFVAYTWGKRQGQTLPVRMEILWLFQDRKIAMRPHIVTASLLV